MEVAKQSPIKVKFKTLNDYGFQSLMQKLANTQTDTMRASHIRRIVKKVQEAQDAMRAQFKEKIVNEYAIKDAEGKVVTTAEKPFDIADDKLEAFNKACEEFGENEAEINWRPLDPHTIAEVKISAREMELLGGLLTEEPVGPGLPQAGTDLQGKVHQLR